MELLRSLFGRASLQPTSPRSSVTVNQVGDLASVVEGILNELGGENLGLGDFLSLAKQMGYVSVSDKNMTEEGTRLRKVELVGPDGGILLVAFLFPAAGQYLIHTVVSSQKEPFQIFQLMEVGRRVRRPLKGSLEDSLIVDSATIAHYFCAVPPRAIEKYRDTKRGVVGVVQHPNAGGRLWREVIGIEPKHEPVHIVSLVSNNSLNMGAALEPLGVHIHGDGQTSRSVFFRDVRIEDGPDSETVILGIIFASHTGNDRLIKGTRPTRFQGDANE